MRTLLFFLLFLSYIDANHISWLGDYDKALQKANQERKPLMVLLVKKECNRCNEVIIKNFMNHDYIDRLNKKFVSVIITYEGKLSYPIELFYSTSFPTLFFVDSQNEHFLREPIYDEEINGFFSLHKYSILP